MSASAGCGHGPGVPACKNSIAGTETRAIHGEGGIDVPRRGHDHCRQRPIQCAWKESNFMSE